MRSRSLGRVRKGLLVSLAAACFVIAGTVTTAAQGKQAKDPTAKRGKKKGQDPQAAGEKKKRPDRAGRKRQGKGAAIRMAMLNEKRIEKLYQKLDANSDGSVTAEEFKALPTVLQEMVKEAAAKAKQRKADGGEKDPAKKRKGGRKKKDANTQ